MKNKKLKNKKLISSIIVGVVVVAGLISYPYIRGNTKSQLDAIQLTDVDYPDARMVRGMPYNEILVVYRYFFKLHIAAYNDIGQILIPKEDFLNINLEDLEVIKEENNALEVVTNGPRFFVMDEITGYQRGAPQSFRINSKDYTLNQVAIVLQPLSAIWERVPYTESFVERTTKYTFFAGEKVYELVSDTNEVYTMQAGSQEIDENLTISDLDSLGSRLTLPEGWQYRVRTLAQNVTYHINGTATMVQDEFRNSYQKNPTD